MQIDPVTNVAKDARILIVDDRKENITTLGQILGRAGYAICISLTDAREALGKFDLVITDRVMPKMNGDQLASAIKEIAPREPVILLTAFADNARQSRDIDLLLSKPASLQMLRQAISKVMAQPN